MSKPLFTKLTKLSHFTDIICIGLSISMDKYQFSERVCYENIHGFHVIHLRPRSGGLYMHGDTLTVDSSDLFDVLTNYTDTRHNTLVVCNHSCVAIGASDFTEYLNSGRITLCESEIDTHTNKPDKSGEVSTQSFCVSSPPTIVSYKCTATNKRYTLVDVANYGCRYMEDIYNNLTNQDKALVHNEAELGVSEDNSLTCCALIAKFMQTYYRVTTEHKLGGMALTYSSQGMRAFRHKHYHDGILPHDNMDARIMESDCYLGGRVEDRYHGYYKGKCYLLDLQSLYPHLGTIKTFPTKLAYTQDNPDKETIEQWLKQYICFAHCHVDTRQPAYPKRTDAGLSFPIGSFSTYLCAEEFADAYHSGDIRHVYRIQAYERDCILKGYSEHMLRIRSLYKQTNRKLEEFIIKLVTNGLWGKFGQIAGIWTIVPDAIADKAYGGYNYYCRENNTDYQYRIINWQVSRLEKAYFLDNTFTPISAVMNSYSRSYLWRHMLQAGLQNVLYCCVDGMIVNQEGFDRLAWLIAPTPYQYGMYKVSEQSDHCNILGHGLYTIGRKIASQGYSRASSKKVVGFWSAIDDTSTLANRQVQQGKQILAINYQQQIQQALLNPEEKEGCFISPTYLEQLIDAKLLLHPLGTLHHTHSPEWLR